jgi:hypothetical protein
MQRNNDASQSQAARRTDEIRRRRAHAEKSRTYSQSISLGVRSAQPAVRRSRTGRGSSARSVAAQSAPAVRVRSVVTPPPVMSRVPLSGAIGRENRKAPKARRRYDVALGMPGAEMRLPSLPQVAIGWRLASFLLVTFLAAMLYYLWTSPAFQSDGAEVAGLNRLSRREVYAALDLEDRPVFTLSPNKLESDLLKAFPEFSAVAVQVTFPDSVAITVTERIPVLTWRQGGRTELVDENGYAFPVRNEALRTPQPVVEAAAPPPAVVIEIGDPMAEEESSSETGLSPEDLAGNLEDQADPAETRSRQKPAGHQLMTRQMVSAILALAVRAPANTPLVYDASHGLGWKDSSGWEVYFGDVQEIATKLKVYKAIVDRLASEGLQPALISVENAHAPYYRLAE